MENAMEWEKKPLIDELIQGRDYVKQLRIHLNQSVSNHEFCELLTENISSSFEKALSMLKWSGSEIKTPASRSIAAGMLESPHSVIGNPWSEESDQDHRDMSKKRKTLPRWRKQVKVCSGAGAELDDGYSWRKYGQKDILGAKYPRGYHRCSYRHVQDCLATKQVQRSDDDPTIFEITYRGKHTCSQSSPLTPAQEPAPSPEKKQKQQEEESKEIILNFRKGLKVETEDLNSRELKSSSFSFPSSSIGSINIDNHIFFPSVMDNNFMGTFSPSFISPVTSDSNYFSVSPRQFNSFGGAQNFRTSELSDFTEIISATTSVTNSPIPELDFTLDRADFDANFPFESLGFLSKFDEI